MRREPDDTFGRSVGCEDGQPLRAVGRHEEKTVTYTLVLHSRMPGDGPQILYRKGGHSPCVSSMPTEKKKSKCKIREASTTASDQSSIFSYLFSLRLKTTPSTITVWAMYDQIMKRRKASQEIYIYIRRERSTLDPVNGIFKAGDSVHLICDKSEDCRSVREVELHQSSFVLVPVEQSSPGYLTYLV